MIFTELCLFIKMEAFQMLILIKKLGTFPIKFLGINHLTFLQNNETLRGHSANFNKLVIHCLKKNSEIRKIISYKKSVQINLV